MPMISTTSSRGRAFWVGPGMLVALLATAFLSWPALSGPFLFDDFPNLEHLATLDGRLDWPSLANYAALFKGEPGRPLSMLSFVINDYDWPSSPWSFKYTNLMLHLLTGVVVFGLARTLALLHTSNLPRSNIAALLTMAAWLLHPMQLSTTMLVVQRMTQVSALFTFCGVWAYAALSQRASTSIRALAAIAALGTGTVLAVLGKETGALAPLLALALNVTLLRNRLEQLPSLPRRILKTGVMLPVAILSAGIIANLDSLAAYGNRPFDMPERLMSQSRALFEYLFNILVPSLRGGGIYHDDFSVSIDLLSPWTTLPATLVVLAMIATALLFAKRHYLYAFAILWFFGGHLLESSIFPLELYFEHRNYLPMFGVLFAVAVWASGAYAQPRPWRLAISLLWIAYAAWLTAIQAPIWGDERALVAVWAIEHPKSPRAIQHRAANYYYSGDEQKAADVLLDAYLRGVRGTDFPAQLLLLACLNRDHALARRADELLPESISAGEYNRALLVTLSKMRAQVQAGTCPDVLSESEWLDISAALLRNANYSTGEPAAYIHTERSHYFRSQLDLNATMIELELAWVAARSPELAQLMAATLASAGLYDDAVSWARKALDSRVGGIRGLFARDDRKSAAMLDALLEMKRIEGSRSEVPSPALNSAPGSSARARGQ